MKQRQLDLFKSVLGAYPLDGSAVSNDSVYEHLTRVGDVPEAAWSKNCTVGVDGRAHSMAKRQVRWMQQDARQLGLIERVDGKRGYWRLRPKDGELTKAEPGVSLVAYSTNLGVALWSSCADAFTGSTEHIDLCLTSPPYPLSAARAYGNPSEREIVNFICTALEPIIKLMRPTGSLALNVSPNIHLPGSPARSLYCERLVLALCDMGMHLHDRGIWVNPNRPPGPMRWASGTRQSLNSGYEFVYIFAKDPHLCKANNRRVLQPHTEAHLKLMQRGGENRTASYGDGSFRLKPGSFGAMTEGRIPRNVLTFPHSVGETAGLRRRAAALGLKPHGAIMPGHLAQFLIRYLTEEGDLVVDPFGGSGTTAKAAQDLQRRWKTSEIYAEYAALSAERFADNVSLERHFILTRT